MSSNKKGKTSIQIELNSEERAELERVSRSMALPHRQVQRAKVVLLLADGETISETSRQTGLERRIVRKWGSRFVLKRQAGLDDEPRSGRPARFSPRGGNEPEQAGMRTSRFG